MNIEGHKKFTDAMNSVSYAVAKLSQSARECPEYKPFYENARNLHISMVGKWKEGVLKGNREGWFKK